MIDGAKYGAALIFDTCPALYNADMLPEPPTNWLALGIRPCTPARSGCWTTASATINLWGRAIGAAHATESTRPTRCWRQPRSSPSSSRIGSRTSRRTRPIWSPARQRQGGDLDDGLGGLTLLPDRGKANIKVVHLQPGDFSFVQALAISAEAPQVPAAHQFINFMLSPNEQAALANRTTRAIVNLGAVPMIDPAISAFTNYADLDSVMAQSPPLGFPAIGESADGTASYLDWALAWDKVRSLKSTAAP